MLVEKKYQLKKEILEEMINLKIEAEEERTMAHELIKFIKSQIVEQSVTKIVLLGLKGVPLTSRFIGIKAMMESSATREYPSLIHTFFVTHTIGGEEMLRVQGLGSNTPSGVPYTKEEINALAQKGKQQGNLPGVGRVFPGRATDFGNDSGSGGCGDDEMADDEDGGEDEADEEDGDRDMSPGIMFSLQTMLPGRLGFVAGDSELNMLL
ncbi:hypothetical protein Tco_1525792 [Tanacetum coccineum]